MPVCEYLLIKIELRSYSHFILLNSRLQWILCKEHYQACAVVEHQLLTHQGHLSSPTVLVGFVLLNP